MSVGIITVDIDWACEAAIEETLDFLLDRGLTPTVFTTHRSPRVLRAVQEMEVGLHPFFDPSSSHGATVEEVVAHIAQLPHNIAAYRCHRFATGNSSQAAMADAGMLISSNVCTDLQVVAPFRNRFGLLEVPIFFEDGGYLWNQHSLELNDALQAPGLKVCLIHPMHFVLNTPTFDRMAALKQRLTRRQWSQLSNCDMNHLRWRNRGIRDLIVDMLDAFDGFQTLGSLLNNSAKSPHTSASMAKSN